MPSNASQVISKEKNKKIKRKLILVLGLTIFFAEFLIMVILKSLPEMSPTIETIIDASTLTIIAIPFLYHFFVKDILFKNEELTFGLLKQKKALDSTTIISHTDIRGIITYANPHFCAISGYSENELIGKNHRILRYKGHTKEFWKSFWDTIKAGEIWKGEICNVAKSGKLYWVDATVIPDKDTNGKILGYIAIRTDITTKKETQKHLEQKSKLASLGEIAAGVGHEINNPLAISTGNVFVLKKALEAENISNERINNSIKKIENANERIKKIVEGLKIFSKDDTEAIEVIYMPDVIKRSVNLIEEIYRREGIQIKVEVNDTHLFVTGNISKLHQILMSLISNAKEAYTDHDNNFITISIYNQDERTLVVNVADNGIGMSKEVMDKIFDPFFTTKMFGAGAGMGLSLVRDYIESMKGKITVKSELGKGSMFTLTFPITDEKMIEEQNKFKMSGNVLVVDDETNVRDILTEYLEDLGFKVETASCGDSALVMLEEKKYHYVCIDIHMPGMDGYELVRQVKKLPNTEKTKYIFISGTVKADQEHFADDFVSKPFTKESLLRAFSKLQ